MTSDPDAPAAAPPVASSGRPIRLEPTPPGLWLMIGGAAVTALAPLFGFLIGSMSDETGADGRYGPRYEWLFAGFVVGGLGAAVMLYGVYRYFRARGPRDAADPQQRPAG
jgi:hypothetical protein